MLTLPYLFWEHILILATLGSYLSVNLSLFLFNPLLYKKSLW